MSFTFVDEIETRNKNRRELLFEKPLSPKEEVPVAPAGSFTFLDELPEPTLMDKARKLGQKALEEASKSPFNLEEHLPKQLPIEDYPVAGRVQGFGRGALELLNKAFTPVNAILITGSAGLSAIHPLVGRAMSVVFGTEMAKGAVESFKAYKKALDDGDEAEAIKIGTEIAGLGAMAAGAIKHGFEKKAPALVRERGATPEETAIKHDLTLKRPPIGPERQLAPPAAPGQPGSVIRVRPGELLPPSRQLTGPAKIDRETTNLLERLMGKPIDQIRKDFVKEELQKAGGKAVEPVGQPVERLRIEKQPEEFDPIKDIYQKGGLSTKDPDTIELKNMDVPFSIFKKGGRSLDNLREAWAEEGRIPEDADLNHVRNIISDGLAAKKAGGKAAERTVDSMLDQEEIDRKITKEAGRVENMSEADLETEQIKWTSVLADKGNLYSRERSRLLEVTQELKGRREIGREKVIQEGKVPKDADYEEFSRFVDEAARKSGIDPNEAGAVINPVEAGQRLIQLARQSKTLKEFQELVGKDVDLQDTVKFMALNLGEVYDRQKQPFYSGLRRAINEKMPAAVNKDSILGKGQPFHGQRGATLLLSEAAARILEIAKKAKDYGEFRESVAKDVDLNDSAKFYTMNLKLMFDQVRKKEQEAAGSEQAKISQEGKARVNIPGIATLQVDIMKAADKFDRMLIQADAVAKTGTIQPKEVRPDLAYGRPGPKNVTNVIAAETIKKFYVDSVVEVERLKNIAENTADDLTIRQLENAKKRFKIASAAFLEQRSIWGRTGHVYQHGVQEALIEAAIKDGRDATAYLKMVKDIKPKLAVLDRIVLATMRQINPKMAEKFAKGEKVGPFQLENAPGEIQENLGVPRAILNAFRLNLFQFGSFIRDSFDNAVNVGTETVGYLGQDIYSAAKGGNPRRIMSIIKSLADQGKAVIPGRVREVVGIKDRTILPAEIEQKLGNEIRDVSGKDSGIMTHIKMLGMRLDYPLSPAVKLKRVADILPSRVFAMADLMHSAAKEADAKGLSGLSRQKFIEAFLKNPAEMGEAGEAAVASAVAIGKKIKFQVDLSDTEKNISGNWVYLLLGDAFPSWKFQYARWVGRTLGADPAMWKKMKSGEAGGEEIAGYFTKAATGWGGIWLVNNIIYPHMDFNSMEYVDDNGQRTRLSGTSIIPTAVFISALFRGEMVKATLALKHTPIPGANLIPGYQAGVLSGWMVAVSSYLKGGISNERFFSEINKIVNNLVPGRATLSLLKVLADPVLRQGLGSEIPFYSKTLPPVINPTTGKPLMPRQERFGLELPSLGGTAIPGFRRIQTPFERELQLHGIGLFRDRRTPIAEFQTDEIPPELRLEYKEIAGEFLARVGPALLKNQDYKQLSGSLHGFDAQTKVLNTVFKAAQDYAVAVIESQRGVKIKQKVTPPRTMGLPEKYAGKRKKLEVIGAK